MHISLICWKAEGNPGPSIEIVPSYDDIIKQVDDRISGALKHNYEYKHQHAKVTIVFALRKPSLQVEGRRKSVLDRLGKSKNILRSVIDLGVSLGQLNSVVSAVFTCLDVVWSDGGGCRSYR
ncbi:hypothetical protein OBBRIDRAFT_457411 [Obba rivulosa]|uniref:Uncharacterized protein n=1 Tax=Obba rivulosa TaxID=1052685 RepID=A0A8E2AXK0_9APHY|nr:hypothetical protein OBBRIDRAFT_457411 [Obba rivulosa]